MKLRIENRVAYHYAEEVGFSPHLVRLFPRQDHRLKVVSFAMETNAGATVQFRRDLFDNVVGRCFYPERSDELMFLVGMEVEIEPRNAFDFVLDAGMEVFPFRYPAEQMGVLVPYLTMEGLDLPEETGVGGVLAAGGEGETVGVLVEFVRAVRDRVVYEEREEGEPYAPAETLRRGRGSCRDTAVLAVAMLRHRGIAARLASGYLSELHLPAGERRAEASLHAWVEVFLPGAGWVGIDPTHGVFCDHCFLAAAVGIGPGDIAPLKGSYYAERVTASSMEARVTLEEMDG